MSKASIPFSRTNKNANGKIEMDDPEKTTSRVAKLVDQLHSSSSSPHEIEIVTACLLGVAKSRKEARALIGSHAQAMPLLVSILRTGTLVARTNVASTLRVLCKESDLRVKVLLGGCIPQLLSLLKSDSPEARKAAAEALCEVSSGGLSDDPVGMKIFVTENVVPTLWEQLNSTKDKRDNKAVEGLIAGTLRNLCGGKDGHWRTTLDASGVHVIVDLLYSDNPVAQSNAASLLARLVMAFAESVPKIIDCGALETLIGLLGQDKDVSVRASAAEVIEAVSSKSGKAKQVIIDAGGKVILIGAIIAPSKEGIQGEWGLDLQKHSMRALANICGGMPELILYLGELSQSPRLAAPVPDIVGALAYTLTVFKRSEDEKPFESRKVENILIMLLKPRDNKHVQVRLLEALASLYGNPHLSGGGVINQPRAKKVLIGLITMAVGNAHEYLISSLIQLCTEGVSVWEALGKREGIQIVISAMGLSSEENQEYAVEMLAILTEQVEDSKWAITAAGGIPHLVRLLEVGSQKARLDATHILWNLGCHSEDIRACVESSGAIPAFLCLLKNGQPREQEATAMALMKLIRTADSITVNQLLPLLTGDSPSSKAHVIKVLGHVLSTASHSDLVLEGAFANVGLRSLVEVFNSGNEKTQEYAATVLADLFCDRQDIYDSLATDEVVNPCIKHLTIKVQGIVSRAFGASSRPKRMPSIAEGDVRTLITLAKTGSIDSAETAMCALANLLSDPQVAADALVVDVVAAITKVMLDGSLEGKQIASRALYQLLKHFPLSAVLTGNAQCRFAILAVVDSLNAMDLDSPDAYDALESVSILSQTSQGLNEVPSSLGPLVRCLCEGPPSVQDKVIGILSRVSRDQPVLLGDLLVSNSRSIGALASRITKSGSREVRVGGTVLLICAAKEHKIQSMDALEASGYMKPLTHVLVNMIKRNPTDSSLEIEVRTPRSYRDRSAFRNGDEFDEPDPATVKGGTVALWLLSIVSSSHPMNKINVMEAGGIEALHGKLARHAIKGPEELEDTEGVWISTVLAAVLFQDATVVLSSMSIQFVQPLAALLKADETIHRFFAAQAMASLVRHGNMEINLAIANSGAVEGITTLIRHLEPSDMPNLLALSDEFSLVNNPEQAVLENLFRIDDLRLGSLAQKTIPSLVDLLRPIPDRPGVPLVSIRLLTQIADGNDTNKLLMAEAGVLDALTKYLSLSPHDLSEGIISELLRILFSNPDLIQYEAAAINCMSQLISVLRLGSRSARLSAARALDELFDADNIRNSVSSTQAIQPLVDMLNSTSESEQVAALSTLINLTSDSDSKITMLIQAEGDPLRTLCKILSSAHASSEVKTEAAELCCVVFGNSIIREMPIASEFIEPLILLMKSDNETAVESGVCAFERLLDDERQLEITSDHDFVSMLVGLVSGSNHRLIEASISALIKLGKDRTPRKLDMVNAGIIDKCLDLLPTAPNSVCAMIAELFRVLTNSSVVSKSSSVAKIVEPLFAVLLKTDIGMWGQHSALQSLVNILEKPQSLSALKATPTQVIEPIISFLESPSQVIQQLGTELLSHLLAQEHFKQDITTKSAIVPLVRLAGIGILDLQQTAIKALEEMSLSWPKEIFDAGGIIELSKVIVQEDPLPPKYLWESTALVLSNIVQSDAEYYYLNVPVRALVRMLHSSTENIVKLALNALMVQEKTKTSSAEVMAEAGAIDSLLDLLRSHQCEEASARLLEALFNDKRVREMKVSKYAIAPLALYLLDPLTRNQTSRLLAALALGDLSQHEGLARASDSVSACRALVTLLEDQPTEDMIMVAVCALQNFVMKSRTNRRAVAEAGGVLAIQELVLCPNPEVAAQVALLIKFMFSNHTLQEYVSNELIGSLTAALEKEVCSVAVNEEVLRTINVIFANFHKLHISEAATLCIPHLVSALKTGSEAAQESVLTTLCLLKHSWATMPLDVSKSQAMVAAEAIPILQMLMKSGPPSFHDRIESLLNGLPGCLTVTIVRANNLKHVMGGTYPFCRLGIGNAPARYTKVVAHNTSPEWNEGFTWAFDVPPKGQNLQIEVRSKSTFGKTPLGKVTIPIDKVVTEGVHTDVFTLILDTNKDSTSRTIEIEITWSNRVE